MAFDTDEARAVSEIGIDLVGSWLGTASSRASSRSPGRRRSRLRLQFRLGFRRFSHGANPLDHRMGTGAETRDRLLVAAPELLGPDQVAVIKAALPGSLIMRRVPVYREKSVHIAQSYEGLADYLLLDSHRPSDKQIGALGVPHDWSIIPARLQSTLGARGRCHLARPQRRVRHQAVRLSRQQGLVRNASAGSSSKPSKLLIAPYFYGHGLSLGIAAAGRIVGGAGLTYTSRCQA